MFTPASRTYTNPVYPRDFPDPFVLRFGGRYFAYATGLAEDGRCFPLLSSVDLVHWTPHGGALPRPDLPGVDAFWAPEVTCSEGTFYLYYAAGREAEPDHHLRLATAPAPLGPWSDAGLNLTPHERFAIDAHPFRDPRDGQRYLFYARDELDPPFAGTGIVVDRLLAMDRLEGRPRRVVRPYAAWQLFERQRAVKHGLDWYTVEGPFVRRVGERYVCFYSGGRWESPNYGVAYALADHPLGPWDDDANAEGPRVLSTVPGRVIGPGHNSVIGGPDLQSEYLVYHGWDPGGTARLPRIDRLEWEGDRPHCGGPTWEPRPAPPLPRLLLFPEAPEFVGCWEAPEGTLQRSPSELGFRLAGSPASLALRERVEECRVETCVRADGPGSAGGVQLGPVTVWVGPFTLRVGDRAVPLHAQRAPGFRPEAWHTLLLRRQGDTLTATLDEYPTLAAPCPPGPAVLALRARRAARFTHLAVACPPGSAGR